MDFADQVQGDDSDLIIESQNEKCVGQASQFFLTFLDPRSAQTFLWNVQWQEKTDVNHDSINSNVRK